MTRIAVDLPSVNNEVNTERNRKGKHLGIFKCKDVKITFVNCMVEETNTEAIFAVMNIALIVVKIRPEENSGLQGIWTHGFCVTDTVLYQLTVNI